MSTEATADVRRMVRGLPKDWRPLADAALADPHWRIRAAKGGLVLYPPDRSARPIAMHLTPGGVRSLRNATSALRRNGLDV